MDQVEGGAQVGAQHVVPVGGIEGAQAALADVDAGRADQHVDGPERGERALDHGGDLGAVGDVADQDGGVRAGGAEVASGLFELGAIPPDEGHAEAGLGESDRDGAANAAAGAGDEGGARRRSGRGHGGRRSSSGRRGGGGRRRREVTDSLYMKRAAAGAVPSVGAPW